jgi:polysaccharide export outer membrane protein
MQLRTKLVKLVAVALLASTGAAFALQPGGGQIPGTVNNPAAVVRLPHYGLGPNDEIVILAIDADEIANKPIRVTTSGDINLPLVGRIHAAGMTLEGLEAEVTERLTKYIKEPHIAINVTQFKSQPVSVFGAVGSPGVVQLEGRKTLIEVLSMAGGLKADAGSRIRITRKSEWGAVPQSSAVTEGEFSVAEVNIRSIEDATRPEDNIQILPFDVITVARAEIVYVMGEVKKSGGFMLNDRRTISLIEVMARAEGLSSAAAPKDAKIIRPVPGANRIEIAVNLRDVLAGKAKDVMLQPDDILYVPNSYAKGAFKRTLDSVIAMTTGRIIYR